MSDEENPFILLDWDPCDLDVDRIKKRIAEKRAEWSKRANMQGPGGVKANADKNRLNDVEDLLVEHKDKVRFQEVVAEARTILERRKADAEKELGRLIEFCVPKGFVSEKEFNKLVKDFARYFSETEIRGRIRVDIRAGTENAKPDEVKPMVESRYKQIRENLVLVGSKDLFDFLTGEVEAFSRKSSSRALHQRANELYAILRRQNNSDEKLDARMRLVGNAQEIFDEKDPQRRKKYELSLDYERIAFLTERMQWAAADGQLNATVYEMLLREGMEVGASRELVEKFLAQEAIKKGLALIKPAESALYDQEACPSCGKLNQRSAKHCRQCTTPLSINCPACDHAAHSSDTACVHCGFCIGEMSRAQPKVEEARSFASKRDFAAALALLAEAERYWPKLASAQRVREDIQCAEQNTHAILSRIRQHFAAGELLAAETLVKSAQLPTTFQVDFEAEITRRRRQALEFCRAAHEQLERQHEQAAFDLLVKAMTAAQDLPEVRQLAHQFAPPPPQQPMVAVKGSSVKVTWIAPAAIAPLQYCLLRRNLSVGETQARVLNHEISGTGFIDPDVEIGQTYEYLVAARRMGVTSPQSPPSDPVTVTDEVRSLSVVPGDRCLNLSWQPPEGAVAFKVTTCVGREPKNMSDGELLNGVTSRGVTAFGLQNQGIYGYRIAAVFRSKTGKELTSVGVAITAKVQSLPPRIDHLALNYTNGKIEASWPPSSCSRVHLLHVQGHTMERGLAIDMANLGSCGVKMPTTNSSHTCFDPPAIGTVSFTIFTEQDGIAVAGATASLEVVTQKAEIREIHFRVGRAGFVNKQYYIELFTHGDSFRAPDLVVYYNKKAPPRQLSDGHFLQQIPAAQLYSRPTRIDLKSDSLAGGHYIGVLIADAREVPNFRIFKPSLDTLKIL